MIRGIFFCCVVLMVPWASDVCLGDSAPVTPNDAQKPVARYVIKLHGGVGEDFTERSVLFHIRRATQLGASVIVLDIDSPGGYSSTMDKIVDTMIQAKGIRFVAYVRSGLSAAAMISLACEDIYMHPLATIGAATPYLAGKDGIVRLSPEVREKFQSVTRAMGRKAAEHGGHSVLFSDAMIDNRIVVTLDQQDGKSVLAEGGTGRVISKSGFLMTLTAKEAVGCGLAKGAMDTLEAMDAKAGLTPCVVPKKHKDEPLYILEQRIYAKYAAAGYFNDNVSELARKEIDEELKKWIRVTFHGKPVRWRMFVDEPVKRKPIRRTRYRYSKNPDAPSSGILMGARGKQYLTFASPLLRETLLPQGLGSIRLYPYLVFGFSPSDHVRISAYYRNLPAIKKLKPGSEIVFQGRVHFITLIPAEKGATRDRCVISLLVTGSRITILPRPNKAE